MQENLVDLDKFVGTSHVSEYVSVEYDDCKNIEINFESESFTIETYYSQKNVEEYDDDDYYYEE